MPCPTPQGAASWRNIESLTGHGIAPRENTTMMTLTHRARLLTYLSPCIILVLSGGRFELKSTLISSAGLRPARPSTTPPAIPTTTVIGTTVIGTTVIGSLARCLNLEGSDLIPLLEISTSIDTVPAPGHFKHQPEATYPVKHQPNIHSKKAQDSPKKPEATSHQGLKPPPTKSNHRCKIMSKYNPDAPPSYTEATTSSSSTPLPSSPSQTPLSSHLANLTSRLRSSRPPTDPHQIDLISLLIPEIESHLSALRAPSRRGAPPRRGGQLTLVPAAAVPAPWHPSEKPDRTDELWQTARVRDVKGVLDSSSEEGDAAGVSSSSSSSAAREFDEWGRWEDDGGDGAGAKAGLWWWRDEELAMKLAELLRPDVRRFRFGERAGDEMKVTAEEVSFRRENEMGIWESMNGWAVVVRITIRR